MNNNYRVRLEWTNGRTPQLTADRCPDYLTAKAKADEWNGEFEDNKITNVVAVPVMVFVDGTFAYI